jgi:heptaprenyl diphosphate synthase
VAILAGDYLLARASSLAASLGAEVAGLLASTIGELCRGQVLELQHLFDVTRSEEAYSSAIEGKTAALFATSCRIGGMVSAVDEPTLDALTRFGHHLGMCFQVVDDVLDLTSSDEALGKPAGQDLLEGVYTLPVIYALGEDDELRALLGTPIDAERLPKVRALATANGAVDAALAVARDHAVKASEALAGADGLDPKVTGGLCRLVDGLVTRDK